MSEHAVLSIPPSDVTPHALERSERYPATEAHKATRPLCLSVIGGEDERVRTRLERITAAARCQRGLPWKFVSGLARNEFAGAAPEQSRADVLLNLGDAPEPGTSLPVWRFVEGGLREDGNGRLRRAASPAACGLALVERHKGKERVLAYQDLLPLAGETQAEMSRRLDGYLPQLLTDAALRRAAGGEGLVLDHGNLTARPQTTAGGMDPKAWVSGASRVAARLAPTLFRRADEARVILMHAPGPDILDRILTLLSTLGPFVRFTDVADALAKRKAPPPGFAITFDDGAKENALLLEVLEKHRCPSMFYIATGALGVRRPLWFMNKTQPYLALKPELKKQDRRGFLELAEREGLCKESPLHWRFGLTRDELRSLRAAGHDIGVHTVTHPFLTRCSDEEIASEITDCHTTLIDALGDGTVPLHVAYPDGDHDNRVASVLERLGARSATTILPGPVLTSTHRLAIPRYGFGDTDDAGLAAFKLTTLYRRLKTV